MSVDRTRVYLSIGGVSIPSVWAHKWLVLAITGLSVLAGMVYVRFAVPVYEVKTRLTIAKGGIPPRRCPMTCVKTATSWGRRPRRSAAR